jgi:hypothetical protein
LDFVSAVGLFFSAKFGQFTMHYMVVRFKFKS